MTETCRVYVYLLEEGTDSWRPVEAIHLHDDVYRIPVETVVPEDEVWEFVAGDTVRCTLKDLSGGPTLVAMERIKDEGRPENEV